MKKQFFRVKQLADQTFLRAEKSEILNHEELQIADQKVEFLRGAITSITKKIAPNGPTSDIEKLIKKSFEYQLGTTLTEESKQKGECHLFQQILRESGAMEQQLAREYAEHERKVEDLVYGPLQEVLENEFPNVLKHKHNLRKYCLDKDSASSRYQATRKENLKDDMEEAETKVEQSRDVLAIEMFNVLAKENEFSEYILQLLKLQRGYHESALKSLETVIPQLEKKIGDSPVRRVFGTSLQEHLRITGKRIAYPLEICITTLNDIGLSEEGLFRVAASTSKVKRLKSAIDSGCFSFIIPEYRDVHVLASILKLYLRELPEPLMTFHLYKEFIEAMQVEESRRTDVLKHIIGKLPSENRDNLSYLFQFLAKLTQHPENKMSSSNIAIVLSPNLLWVKNDKTNANMENCVLTNMLIELFIKKVEVLFPEDVSTYVTISGLLQDDEHYDKPSHTGHDALNSAESPRPNTRKKKSAPVPPNNVSRPPEGLNKSFSQSKSDIFEETRVSVGVNTDDLPRSKGKEHGSAHVHAHFSHDAQNVDLVNLRGDEKRASESSNKPQIVRVIKPEERKLTDTPIKAQVQSDEPTLKFKTVVSHPVNQPALNPPAAEKKVEKAVSPLSKRVNTFDVIETETLRRKDRSNKPEIPARPSSLQSRPELLKKTQCSVYNVANKQQPSIINIHTKNDSYLPGHDSQLGEKERFLGHQPDKPKDQDVNSNCEGSAKCDNQAVKTKSNEYLNVYSDKVNENVNGNQKSSHVRARSDGNLIDLERGAGNNFAATRSFSKPTEPPPPPPEL